MGSNFKNPVQIKFIFHMLVQIKLHELTHPQTPWWTQLQVQKWRQHKEKELSAFLAHNTSGVEGRARAPGWD
jgi:hypothetical protein